MNIPENLAEGLNLAGAGMAVVFAALVVFMLILMALQKLFPGEEMEMEVLEAAEASEAPQVAVVNSDEEAPEPVAVMDNGAGGRIPGSQIAAMAVALYLAMEQEEQAQLTSIAVTEPVSATAPVPTPTPVAAPHGRSSWGRIGREALLDTQGRRAPSYGNRPQSAYNPRGSERS